MIIPFARASNSRKMSAEVHGRVQNPRNRQPVGGMVYMDDKAV